MRRAVLAVLAIGAVSLSIPVASAASTASVTTKSSAVVVSGLAGTEISVMVSPGTALSNGGGNTDMVADKGGWAGIALVAPSPDEKNRPSDLFQFVSFSQAYRCPGSACPWTAGPPAADTTDLEGRLAPGRHWLLLEGITGARVTVRLHPSTGRIQPISGVARRRITLETRTTIGSGPVGHETQLHAFDSIPASHRWGFVISYELMSIEPAGLQVDAGCATAGPTHTIVASQGGVLPCADHNGFDFLSGPDGGLTSSRGIYAPVEGFWTSVSGAQQGDEFGAGYDHVSLAPTSYLRNLFIGYSLPFN